MLRYRLYFRMKKMKKLLICIFLIISLMLPLASCGNRINSTWVPNNLGVNLSSDSLYVRQVDNITDEFIMGMDASCVPALEASGVKYYDFDGTQKDVYQILSENGINYIRVRIWNDPFDSSGNGYGGGNCDIENAIAVGKRATEYGMKLLVNFHYSDFWADPAKQMVPKAWKGMTIDEKSEALYEYTKECLEKLVSAGVDVGMVQIGNETNGAMAGESSSALGGWKKITQLMNAGAKAVREVCPNALAAVHFANPEKITNYESYGKNLEYYQVDYDVFASSYYPFWHGTLDNLASVLSNIAETYGKKVMIAETSYAFTAEDTDFYGNTIGEGGGIVKDYPFTVQGQANLVRNVIDTAVNKIKNCIGVFYWEGTWISVGGDSYESNLAKWEKHGSGWASSYAAEYDPDDAGKWYGGCAVDNQAFFDASGKALESLKVFGLVKNGNIVENKADAIEDINLIIDLNGEIVLPETVNAIMLDNSKNEIPVEWHNVNIDAMKNGGVAKYEIKGTAGGMGARCYVSMVEYNFLHNWSFEEGENAWNATAIGKFDELKVEDKVTDSLTGTKHYHFWGASANTVEFTLEQQVDNLKSGKYNYAISIMGGDGGETTIYAYVKINGEIAYKEMTEISVYNEWHTATINNIEYSEGDAISVGIYVKCAGPNAWGKIDDALLNSVGEHR
ncbi:MAG: glycosyl hydrolase 53 family protein [Clostridia bacterium]|nr:glycosyl hydrolase 53 family protein [Clostridia bacterium]